MIKINLLPEGIREDIEYAKKNRQTASYVYLSIILAILLVLAFGMSYFFLSRSNGYFIERLKENQESIAEYQQVSTEAKELEGRLSSINKIKGDYKYWSKFNALIWNLLPTDAYINTIENSTDNDIIKITGFAKTKKAVGEFQKALEADAAFSIENIETIARTPEVVRSDLEVESFVITLYLEKGAINE